LFLYSYLRLSVPIRVFIFYQPPCRYFFIGPIKKNYNFNPEKLLSSLMKNMPVNILKIFILLGFLIFSRDIKAQKVAVVLSGGGSRGAAHIGVLKALEENNIPIDYITGTSIGAMVAAMYASGFSPEEIEAYFVSGNFARLTSSQVDNRYSYYYKKDLPDAGWIDLDLDFKKNISAILPENMISTVEMDFKLMKLFAGASAVSEYNFDNLFIPFRCTASDIDSNQTIVLSSGDLGKSVRASLTFPFHFKPIKIDNRLLFDGGMYNNFPLDVALKDFKPDVIIGSKVAGNYSKPDPDDVLSQIQNMLMSDTDFKINPDSGILIEPPVAKVDLLDFSKSQEFINSGYDETNLHIESIKKLISKSRDRSEVMQKREKFNKNKPDYLIDSIQIDGLNRHEASYVYRTLLHKSSEVSLDEIEPEYFNLATDDKLEINSACMKFDSVSGKYTLCMEIKSADKFLLKFGGNISTRIANQAFVELEYKYLFRDALRLKANVYFGRFYSSALLGGRLDFPSKLPVYLGGRLVYNHFDFFKSNIHFFSDITPSFLIQDDNYFKLYAGIPTSKTGKLETAATIAVLEDEYYQSNIFSREDTADQTQFRCYSGSLSWEMNSLNRKQFASAGAKFLISVSYVSGNEIFTSGSLSNVVDNSEQNHSWGMVKLIWDNYFEKLGPVQFGFYGELYLSNQNLFGNYTASLLAAPAFEPVPESKTLFLPNFRAYNYGTVGLKAVVSLSKRFDLRAEAYVFQPYREILRSEDNTAHLGGEFEKRYLMATGALVYHTFFGPISLTANYFDNPEGEFYLTLNIGYIIFNKRAYD
jgi:NTE family protein